MVCELYLNNVMKNLAATVHWSDRGSQCHSDWGVAEMPLMRGPWCHRAAAAPGLFRFTKCLALLSTSRALADLIITRTPAVSSVLLYFLEEETGLERRSHFLKVTYLLSTTAASCSTETWEMTAYFSKSQRCVAVAKRVDSAARWPGRASELCLPGPVYTRACCLTTSVSSPV